MKPIHRFLYRFWRSLGSVAFTLYHVSQAQAHTAYKKSGGRRVNRETRFAKSAK
jgi:hypothetical protein